MVSRSAAFSAKLASRTLTRAGTEEVVGGEAGAY